MDKHEGRPFGVDPIAYCELARKRSSAFGGAPAARRDRRARFLPGHAIRAIRARIRAHFGGSPLRFIQWLDAQVHAGGLRDATARNAR